MTGIIETPSMSVLFTGTSLHCGPIWDESPGLLAQKGILPPHPWMLKQQKLTGLSPENITQFMGDVSHKQLSGEDGTSYGISLPYSFLLTSQLSLESDKEPTWTPERTSSMYGSAQFFLSHGDVSTSLSMFCSSDDCMPLGTAFSSSSCSSGIVPFDSTGIIAQHPQSVSTTIASTAAVTSAAQYSDHQQQQVLPLLPVTWAGNYEQNVCLDNQSSTHVTSPLLPLESPIRVQSTKKDTEPLAAKSGLFNHDTAIAKHQQLLNDGQGHQQCSSLPATANERRRKSSSCTTREKSPNQHQHKGNSQRPTHDGCSTYVYKLKKAGVDKPRKYRCDHEGCDKAYKKSCNLRDHKTTHSEIKQFRCPNTDCSKAFHRKDQLNRHMQIHNNEKRYNCPSCHKRFSRSDHVLQHQNRRHCGTS